MAFREGDRALNKMLVGDDERFRAYYGDDLVFGVAPTPPDTLALEVSPLSLNIVEGEVGVFRVALNKQPESDVTVAITEASPDYSINPVSLDFTTSNWHIFRDVTVTTVQDLSLIHI